MLEILVVGILLMLFIWLGTKVDITPVLMGIVWTIFFVGWINAIFGNADDQATGSILVLFTAPILLIRLFYLRHKRKVSLKRGGAE